ncbi:MAG: hypothetical protein O3C71_00810, partial [Actinomycetota bacterium]|nr:hypothetical protein [Actinomycetota bacterium]
MKKSFLLFLIIFVSCSQIDNSNELLEETISENESITATTDVQVIDETTTTLAIEQVSGFEDVHYEINKNKS